MNRGGVDIVNRELRKLAGKINIASEQIRTIIDRVKQQSTSTMQAAGDCLEVVESLSSKAGKAQAEIVRLQTMLGQASQQH